MVVLWLDVEDRDGGAWVGHRWDTEATQEQMNAAILSVEAWVRALKIMRGLAPAEKSTTQPYEDPIEAKCGDCGQPVVRLYLWAHRTRPDDEHCPKGPTIEGWDSFCAVIRRDTDGATLHGQSQQPTPDKST